MALAAPVPARAGEDIAVAGRLKLSGDYALDRESVRENPSLAGRLKIDGAPAGWRLHAWLEGGWDGTAGGHDHELVKRFDQVYQESTLYLDLKELYAERRIAGANWRVGVQRLAWGRLDEYPINDLFNPWDYGQFIVKPMEERKLGVPAVSASLGRGEWMQQLVWVPWLVPYRLPGPASRWALTPQAAGGLGASTLDIQPREPDLPARTIENGAIGLRLQHQAGIDWAVNLFHGFDPRPVFKTTALTISESPAGFVIDPGYIPSFHRISALGLDAAAVVGPISLRAEAAGTKNRPFNVRQEIWGYPQTLAPGVFPLNQVEVSRDTIDYGMAADWRPVEDVLLTVQGQQTVILDRPDTLYERSFETLLWANLRIDWLNQKITTTLNLADNPEHGATLLRAGISYVFTDYLKAGLHGLLLHGPPQSLFGRYAANDQLGLEVIYQW